MKVAAVGTVVPTTTYFRSAVGHAVVEQLMS